MKWLKLCVILSSGLVLVKETSATDSLRLKNEIQLKNGVEPTVQTVVDSVRAQDGKAYSLAALKPYAGLFSDKYFASSHDKASVIDARSNSSILVSVLRASYPDGTLVLAEKNDLGQIVYVEVRQASGVPITFLLKNSTNSNTYLTFTEEDMDTEKIKSQSFFGIDPQVPGHLRRKLPKHSDPDSAAALPSFKYRRGDGTSSDCTYFKVVEVAIMFDGEFCALLGSFDAAASHIQMVVASASVYYENDMCVKLKLTDIASPETRCKGNGFFGNFNRDKACGNEKNVDTFLEQFSVWAKNNRASAGVDPDAIIHLFSGHPPNGPVGCAWIGTACRNSHAYAIEYMLGRSLHTQTVIFAHELGHNLNADHQEVTNEKDYIMEPFLGNARDGFSQDSANTIIDFLDSVTCDSVEEIGPSPTRPPTPIPTAAPVVLPSPNAITCEDDEGEFELNSGAVVGCWYVQKFPDLTEKRCLHISHQGRLVKEFCPASCGTCAGMPPPNRETGPTPSPVIELDCKDIPGKFEIEKDKFVACSWVEVYLDLTEKRCARTSYQGPLVSDLCEKSCNMCGNGGGGDGSQCQDSAASFTLSTGAPASCAWTTKFPSKTSRRCSETTYNGEIVRNICPESCGGC